MRFLKSFIVLILHIGLILILYEMISKGPKLFFCICIDVPTQYVLKNYCFPVECTFDENQLIIQIQAYFLNLSCSPLILSILMLVEHCFDYCTTVLRFEVRKCGASKFVLQFKDCFGYLGSLAILCEFDNGLFISTKN